MAEAKLSKYYVICKDCGHSGAPRVRLSGKIYLLIAAFFFGILLLLVNPVDLVVPATLVAGIATFVVIYIGMRVSICAVCGSKNVDEVIPMEAIVAPGDSQRQAAGDLSSSTESFRAASVETQSPKKEINRLVACKECGNMISRKAEICPKCGIRYRPSAQSNSEPGFIVSLFKLVGGVVGTVVGLMFAVSLLEGSNSRSAPAQIFGSGGDSVAPTRKLEIHCDELSKALPVGNERDAAYQSCIAGGRSAIRAQERINAEGR